MILLLVAVSLGVQLLALGLALRLIRVTGGRLAWILVAAAIFLMALRRSVTFYRILSGDVTQPPDLTAEGIALLISILLSGGLILIEPLFARIRRSEQEKAEAERRFRSLIENAFEGVLLARADGSWIYASEASARILAYPLDEFMKINAFDLLPPEQLAGARSVLQEALDHPGRRVAGLFPLRCKDGAYRWLEIMMQSRLDDSVIGAIVVNWRDVTERRRMEQEREQLLEQLRQAQKMEAMGRLAGGVAHDFNNLLTVMLGYGDALRRKLPPGDPMRSDAEAVCTAAQRASSLTQQLLAFSRKQVLTPSVLDLHEVVVGMEPMLRRLIREDVELVIRRGADSGNVRADAGQLGQVIMNLVVNARDAMPQGGRLILETAGLSAEGSLPPGLKPGRYVRLAVSDTGTGIQRDVQSRMFEPFFTTKEPGKGTGLGLSTAYGIVRQSGGTLEVSSEPGKGACFTVHLPRVDDPVAREEAAPPEAAVPRGAETLLLVEDEQSVRQFVQQTLLSRGYQVLEAGSGAEALAVARAHRGPIQLLVSDLVMPGMGGRELARQLTGLRPELRVLFMSGYTGDELSPAAPDQGPAFIAKPFTMRPLLEKVAEVLAAPPTPRP